MGKLAPEFANLVTNATTLPLGEDAAEALNERTLPELEAVAGRASDLLGEGLGALLVAQGVRRSGIPSPVTADALARDPGFEAVLEGVKTVGPGEDTPALVVLCQRALQAVAARVADAPRSLALVAWGADGTYGPETSAAVEAFQDWRGLAGGARGVFGRAEARALLDTLAATKAPDLFPDDEDVSLPTPGAQRLVEIATRICDATLDAPFSIRIDGRRYSYAAEHFGVEPAMDGHLEAPGGVSYRVRPGDEYWKCNIFGGTCVSLAELPVPTHALSSGSRHFPRAERFGDALAAKRGWTRVRHLDHRDPADPTRAVAGPQQDEEIRALLREIRPGDLFFVDHPGKPGDDGGHTRLCVEAARPDDPDAAPRFAQARRDKARIEADGVDRLGAGEEIQFWVVRYTGRAIARREGPERSLVHEAART